MMRQFYAAKTDDRNAVYINGNGHEAIARRMFATQVGTAMDSHVVQILIP